MATKRPRKRAKAGRPAKPVFEPSPEQIAAECEKIRAGWSELDRARRVNKFRGRVEPVSRYRIAVDVEVSE